MNSLPFIASSTIERPINCAHQLASVWGSLTSALVFEISQLQSAQDRVVLARTNAIIVRSEHYELVAMRDPPGQKSCAGSAQRSFANCVGKSIGMGRCTLRRSDFLSNLSLVVSATATIHSPQSSFLHKQTENAPTQIVLGACRIVAMKTQRVTHIRICHASRIGFRQLEYGVLQQGETKLRFFRRTQRHYDWRPPPRLT